jgi:hypothetical protein
MVIRRIIITAELKKFPEKKRIKEKDIFSRYTAISKFVFLVNGFSGSEMQFLWNGALY